MNIAQLYLLVLPQCSDMLLLRHITILRSQLHVQQQLADRTHAIHMIITDWGIFSGTFIFKKLGISGVMSCPDGCLLPWASTCTWAWSGLTACILTCTHDVCHCYTLIHLHDHQHPQAPATPFVPSLDSSPPIFPGHVSLWPRMMCPVMCTDAWPQGMTHLQNSRHMLMTCSLCPSHIQLPTYLV